MSENGSARLSPEFPVDFDHGNVVLPPNFFPKSLSGWTLQWCAAAFPFWPYLDVLQQDDEDRAKPRAMTPETLAEFLRFVKKTFVNDLQRVMREAYQEAVLAVVRKEGHMIHGSSPSSL